MDACVMFGNTGELFLFLSADSPASFDTPAFISRAPQDQSVVSGDRHFVTEEYLRSADDSVSVAWHFVLHFSWVAHIRAS